MIASPTSIRPSAFLFIVIAGLLFTLGFASPSRLQPKIITVESQPARKVFGSLSDPTGSVWCNGLPTYWMVGHQSFGETPWCLRRRFFTRSAPSIDYTNSKWKRPKRVVLDKTDEMNGIHDKNLDRHDCVGVDVNHDGLKDIICGVGANKGKGYGFTEVYLANNNSTNGAVKVLTGHGLHKYPTTRTRIVKTLQGADGSDLLFIAAQGAPRQDNQTNVHRMYRNVNATATPNAVTANATPSENAFYFEEVTKGPWKLNTLANCVLTEDLNNDGFDDLVICNQRSPALIFFQKANGNWNSLPMEGPNAKEWRNARAADVTGDGLVDLVVVGTGRSAGNHRSPSYVRVFKGSASYPHFDFNAPIYERLFDKATPDVEILDVNDDQIPDLYVVLSDETTDGTYCAGVFNNRKWWEKRNQPPKKWIPPTDFTNDMLLVGTGHADNLFTEVVMKHAEPGCGWIAERFGSGRTMILAQGTTNRPGHNLLLQW